MYADQPIIANPLSDPLAGLAVNRVLAAPRAVLLQFHTIGVVGLVLIRRVVPALAFHAGEGDHCAHSDAS